MHCVGGIKDSISEEIQWSFAVSSSDCVKYEQDFSGDNAFWCYLCLNVQAFHPDNSCVSGAQFHRRSQVVRFLHQNLVVEKIYRLGKWILRQFQYDLNSIVKVFPFVTHPAHKNMRLIHCVILKQFFCLKTVHFSSPKLFSISYSFCQISISNTISAVRCFNQSDILQENLG